MDPTVAYFPHGYASSTYYYEGYDGAAHGSDDYSRYVTPDVVDASHVVVCGCMHSYISLFQEHASYCCISLKPL
ncbi:hypothetical protein HanRHA438_Chr13g0585321 [Helianthus annuus]|nr:hypothetical protein HanRHA438_Chr13g0585321 [Helianthus annuus]